MENMLIINVLMFTIVALLVLSAFLLYSFFKARRKERQKRPAMVLFTGKAPPIPKAEPIQFLPTAHGSVEIRAPRPKPSRPVRLAAADAHILPPSGDGSPPSEDENDTSLDFSIDVTEPEKSGAVDRLPDSLFGIVFDKEESDSLSFGQNTAEQPTEVPPVELAKNTGPVPSGAMIFKKRGNITPGTVPILSGNNFKARNDHQKTVPRAGDTLMGMRAPTFDELQTNQELARSPNRPESRNS